MATSSYCILSASVLTQVRSYPLVPHAALFQVSPAKILQGILGKLFRIFWIYGQKGCLQWKLLQHTLPLCLLSVFCWKAMDPNLNVCDILTLMNPLFQKFKSWYEEESQILSNMRGQWHAFMRTSHKLLALMVEEWRYIMQTFTAVQSPDAAWWFWTRTTTLSGGTIL